MERIDSKGPCFDALRLSPKAQADVLAQLHKQQGASTNERRVETRYHFKVQTGVVVKVNHPGGSTVTYIVQVRNISNTGIAFLHGSFLYPGTKCAMVLRKIDGESIRLEGAVARCEHVRGHVHDIGVAFNQPIQANVFVTNAEPEGQIAPSTQVSNLKGKVLCIEDSISDQELMKFQLNAIGIEIDIASSGLDGVAAAEKTKYDAVITSVWLPGMSGGEVAACLKKNNYAGPIIAVTSDERPEAKTEALEHGCTHLLLKPFKFEELVKILEQHLPKSAPAEANEPPMFSELWSNEAMRPLIRTFLGRLETQVGEIRRLAETKDAAELLQKICLDVKGSAGNYGFPKISDSANRLVKLSSDTAAVEGLKSEVEALIRLCHSACKESTPPATVAAHDGAAKHADASPPSSHAK